MICEVILKPNLQGLEWRYTDLLVGRVGWDWIPFSMLDLLKPRKNQHNKLIMLGLEC